MFHVSKILYVHTEWVRFYNSLVLGDVMSPWDRTLIIQILDITEITKKG